MNVQFFSILNSSRKFVKSDDRIDREDGRRGGHCDNLPPMYTKAATTCKPVNSENDLTTSRTDLSQTFQQRGHVEKGKEDRASSFGIQILPPSQPINVGVCEVWRAGDKNTQPWDMPETLVSLIRGFENHWGLTPREPEGLWEAKSLLLEDWHAVSVCVSFYNKSSSLN